MTINYKKNTFVWAFIILALSITPGNYIPPIEFKLIAPDTVAHVLFYLVLIFLVLKWQEVSSKQLVKIVIIFSITVLYGFSIELIQGNLIPGRFYDVYDVLSNSIGSVVGLIVYFLSTKYNNS